MAAMTLTRTNEEMLVHIPMSLARRGGRKQVVLPDDLETPVPRIPLSEDPVALAVARGFRWRALLDNSTYRTVGALAKAVHMDTPYVARTIRLTLLAPDIIDAIMAGHCPPGINLKRLSRTFPMRWDEQRRVFNVLTEPTMQQ